MPNLRRVDVDFVDTAAVVLSTDVDLPASTDEVWETIVDNDSWPRWLTGCRSVSASSAVWATAGDTRTVRLGVMKIDEVAVALDARERWVICLTRTSLPIATAMIEMLELADTSRNGETRTEVRWTGAMDPPPLLRPFVPLVGRRLVDLWGRSLEELYEEVVSRR